MHITRGVQVVLQVERKLIMLRLLLRLIQEGLAHRFDVSRMTLRPVLSQLDKEELIIYRPGEGAFVK